MAEKTIPTLSLSEESAIVVENAHYRCETKLKVVKCSNTWSIYNFSFCNEQTGDYLSSEIFAVGDSHEAKWRIDLYPRGNAEKSKDHVAVFLRLIACNKAKVMVKFNLHILDAEGDKKKTMKASIHHIKLGGSSGFSEFIENNDLLDRANGLLPNDRLTILCELSVVDETIVASSKTTTIPIKVPSCQLRKNLGTILESKQFSDVTLVAGGRKFQVHKMILAAHSPVFSAMFEHEMEENTRNLVDITDIDSDVLEEVLRFIYTDTVKKLDIMAEPLLAAANKYALDRLKAMSEEALRMNLRVGNAVDILILADLHNADQLKAQALDFIGKHAAKVVEAVGYDSLINPSRVHLLDEVVRASVLETHSNLNKSMENETKRNN